MQSISGRSEKQGPLWRGPTLKRLNEPTDSNALLTPGNAGDADFFFRDY
jgi:hypothetical protein